MGLVLGVTFLETVKTCNLFHRVQPMHNTEYRNGLEKKKSKEAVLKA